MTRHPIPDAALDERIGLAEIIGPSGRVHYRRPLGDPLIDEAKQTLGYSVRIVPDDPLRARRHVDGRAH